MFESIKANCWELCGVVLDQYMNDCSTSLMSQRPMGTVLLSKDQCTLGQHRILLELLGVHALSSLVILRTLLAVLLSFLHHSLKPHLFLEDFPHQL